MTDRCVACGVAALSERIVPFEVEHDGMRGRIEDRQTHCSSCGQVSYDGEQASEHERAVAAKVRELLGVLSAEELRNVRGKYCLLQREMEQLLSIGPKTWVRWERGKVVQSKAVDTLIRSLAEDPALAHRLMKVAGVKNEEAEIAFGRFHEQARRRAVEVLRSRLGTLAGLDLGALAEDVMRVIQPAEPAEERRRVAA